MLCLPACYGKNGTGKLLPSICSCSCFTIGLSSLEKKMLILKRFFDYFGYYALTFILNFDYFDTMH